MLATYYYIWRKLNQEKIMVSLGENNYNVLLKLKKFNDS